MADATGEEPMDFSKMKKKKKAPPAAAMAASDNPAADGGDQTATLAETAGAAEPLDFAGLKKKKKTKVILDELVPTDEGTDATTPQDGVSDGVIKPVDLTYEQLLDRVFNIMRERNPNAGEKKQFVIRPPEVVKAGAKKTSFVNFLEISKAMNREPKHVLSFILAELGTSGSIDGNNTLILKGKFQVKQMENILRRYIKEYVMCHTCKSRDTRLQKSDRLQFLQCDSCHSRCTVSTIRTGFQATTTKRAAVRAKET
jgi:translation initiation factor 2 subunit 2